MTIDEELSIINDNIDEYGQTNITREEYAMIYRKGREHCQDKLRILEEWKNDVINSLCKYDCNSVEEVAHNAYNKAIDDFVKFASDMPTVEEEDGYIRPMWLEEMAKELKENNNERPS